MPLSSYFPGSLARERRTETVSTRTPFSQPRVGLRTQPSPDSPGRSLLAQTSALPPGLTRFSLRRGPGPVLGLPPPGLLSGHGPHATCCLLRTSRIQRPLSRASLRPAPTFTGKWKPSRTSSPSRHDFLRFPNSCSPLCGKPACSLPCSCSFGPSEKTLET